jgi:hypothetical protein
MAETVMLGAICPDLTSPTTGAELWYVSQTYGQQTNTSYAKAPLAGLGNSSPLTIRTPDYAPAGKVGRLRLRRVNVGVSFQFGGVTVQVTPIVNFNTSLAAQVFPHGSPPASTRLLAVERVGVARACTYVALQVVLTRWSGRVEVFDPEVAFTMSEAASGSLSEIA